MDNPLYIAEPGDILAVEGTAWFSRLIMWATAKKAPLPVSHVGLVISDDPHLVIEALQEVHTRSLETSIAGSRHAYLLKPYTLTPAQRATIVVKACEYSAANYGYGKILLQALDFIIQSDCFTRTFARSSAPICSWLVAKAYESAGLTFGHVDACTVTPVDIVTYALHNPQRYRVFPLKVSDAT